MLNWASQNTRILSGQWHWQSLLAPRGSILPAILTVLLAGCSDSKRDPEAGAPPPATVERLGYGSIRVDHHHQFTLVPVVERALLKHLTAIGTVRSDALPGIFTVSGSAVGPAMPIPGFLGPQAQPTHLWVECNLPERTLAAIRLGEPVELQALRRNSPTCNGRVIRLCRARDAPNRRATVWISMNKPEMARPGTFVIATFQHCEKRMSAVVPATAVLSFHGRDWVYVPDGENRFRRVDIVTGDTLLGNFLEVTQGLDPGDEVVRDALVLQQMRSDK